MTLTLVIFELIFIILSIPTTYMAVYLDYDLLFNEYVCSFINYIQSVLVSIIVYIFVLISFIKHREICYPLKSEVPNKLKGTILVIIFLLSFFLSVPTGMFTQLVYDESGIYNQVINSKFLEFKLILWIQIIIINSKTNCIEIWPETLENYFQPYNFFLTFIQYLLPVMIILFLYMRIGLVLNRSKTPGVTIKTRDDRILESKRRVN